MARQMRWISGTILAAALLIVQAYAQPCDSFVCIMRVDECPITDDCAKAKFIRFEAECTVCTSPEKLCCLKLVSVYQCRKGGCGNGDECGERKEYNPNVGLPSRGDCKMTRMGDGSTLYECGRQNIRIFPNGRRAEITIDGFGGTITVRPPKKCGDPLTVERPADAISII